MQIKLSKSVAGTIAGIVSISVAFAHPGHSTTDPVAELSQPLAGADHFAAFLALMTVLLWRPWSGESPRGQKEAARK
jgi:hydrogenase/urease accessory protein HupE